MTPVLRAYLLAMAAPAVVLTAMLLVGPSAAPGDPVLLLVLLLLGAVASNFPVIVSPRLKTDAAPAVYLAAVLLFTPVTAVALIGGSRLLGEGVLCLRRNPATGFHRRPPVCTTGAIRGRSGPRSPPRIRSPRPPFTSPATCWRYSRAGGRGWRW